MATSSIPAPFTRRDYSSAIESVNNTLNLFYFNTLLDRQPHIGSFTYLIIRPAENSDLIVETSQVYGVLHTELHFEDIGCQKASCMDTFVGGPDSNNKCDPNTAPFSQKLQNGTFVDRCQPSCYGARIGVASPTSRSTTKPDIPFYGVWLKNEVITTNRPVYNAIVGQSQCALIQKDMINSLVNPYAIADPKWGVEDYGLNISYENPSPNDGARSNGLLPTGKVYENHCRFYDWDILNSESPSDELFHMKSNLDKFWRSGDKECGLHTGMKILSYIIGTWGARLSNSDIRMRYNALKEGYNKKGTTVPAETREPPSVHFLADISTWKLHVNNKTTKLPVPTQPALTDIFSAQDADYFIHGLGRIYWTNKTSVVEEYKNRGILPDKWGGIVIREPITKAHSSATDNNDYNTDRPPHSKGRRDRRAAPQETTVDADGGQLRLDGNNPNHVEVFIRKVDDYLSGAIKAIIDMLNNPETYKMFLTDEVAKAIIGQLEKAIQSTVVRSVSRIITEQLLANFEMLAVKFVGDVVLVEATVLATRSVLLTIAKIFFEVAASNVIGLILTIVNVVDLVFNLIWDPFGLAKPGDGDTYYRAAAYASYMKLFNVFGAHHVEYTPALYLHSVYEDDKVFNDHISAITIIAASNYLAGRRLNSNGEARLSLYEGDVVMTHPTDPTAPSIVGVLTTRVRQMRVARMITSDEDVFRFEEAMDDRRAATIKICRWVAMGVFVSSGVALINAVVGLCLMAVVMFVSFALVVNIIWNPDDSVTTETLAVAAAASSSIA